MKSINLENGSKVAISHKFYRVRLKCVYMHFFIFHSHSSFQNLISDKNNTLPQNPLSEVQLHSQRQFFLAGALITPKTRQQYSQLSSSKVTGFSPSGFSFTYSAAAGILANSVIHFANIYFHTNQHMWLEVSFHILGSNTVSDNKLQQEKRNFKGNFKTKIS